MVLDARFATDHLASDPPLVALAGQVRNLSRRVAAAADELARLPTTTCDLAAEPAIARHLKRAASLLGGLTVLRD